MPLTVVVAPASHFGSASSPASGLGVASIPASGGSAVVASASGAVPSDEVEASGGYREIFANARFRRFICYTLLIMVSGYAQIEIGYPAFASLVSHVSTRVVAFGLAANTFTIVVAQLFVLRWMRS